MEKFVAVPFASDSEQDDMEVELEGMTCWNVPCCGAFVGTVRAFEAHYALVHAYACNMCKSSFPSERWLSMHLDEVHQGMWGTRACPPDRNNRCSLLVWSWDANSTFLRWSRDGIT
jgi:hypothetical protein